MLRKSAHALPGLLVCLFAVQFAANAGAGAGLRVDESATRARLTRDTADVALAFVNPTGRDVRAHVLVEILNPAGDVRAGDERDEQISPGANSILFSFKSAILNPREHKNLPWYRLRYVVTTADAPDNATAIEGVVSLSEIAPDLFELNVATPEYAFDGLRFRARVRASNPSSHRPAKGVRVEGAVTLVKDYEDKKSVRAAGLTDAEGLATLDFDLPRGVAADDARIVVKGRLGDFEQEAEDDVTFYHMAEILVGTDKPLYQPGQTLHVRALFVDQLAHRAIPDAEAKLKIRDPDGTNVFSTTLRTSRFGVVSCDWPIAESTRLGDYSVEVEIEEGVYENSTGGQHVRISRYELPTYVVNVKPDKKFYLPGENAEVVVSADYLFGEPVRRGRVRVVREAEREWNYKEQKWETDEGEAYEGETDAEGRFVARVNFAEIAKSLLEDESSSTHFVDTHFAAYFTDPTTNRTEQRRFDLRVTREPIHVYVVEKSYSHPADIPDEFYVTAFYADGTPARATITVAENPAPPDVASTIPPGAFAPPVLAEVKTNRFGLAKINQLTLGNLKKDDDGDVPLKFTARDASGLTGTATESFNLDDDDSTRVSVETDKTIYRAGEPLRVVVTSNRDALTLALDIIEDNRVVRAQTVRLSGGRASVLVPYRREFGGEVTITAYTLPDDADDENPRGGSRVVLFPRESELKLDVRTDKKEYKPGEEAGAEIRVRDAAGREVESVVGVVVTDRAVEERTRTEREFGGRDGFGGYEGSFLYRLGEGNSLAGVSRRDLEHLDARRPTPEGLDLLAEMMLNKSSYPAVNAFGQGFADDQRSVFSQLLDQQLKPVRDALAARYKQRGEYPRDAATLRRFLGDAGVNLDAMRDPWGRPYQVWFGTRQDEDILEIISAAADKRDETGDDFVAMRASWLYFLQTGEAIQRVALHYFERTHRTLRDRETFISELKRERLDFDALRDRWGKPYDVQFDVEGRNALVKIVSGGPDGRFTSARKTSHDDFTVWTARVDYFTGDETRIRAALDKFVNEGHAFPRNEAELREALRAGGVEESALNDVWGRPYALSFKEADWNPGRVRLRSYARYGNAPKEQAVTLPARRRLFSLSLRSIGNDAKADTLDDIQIANFSRVIDVDAKPAPKPSTGGVAKTSQAVEADGALSGTITDVNGAAISNAKVRCANRATGFERETTTNEEGVFLFDGLEAGTYEVTIASAGFISTIVTDVPVGVAKVTELNAELQVGAVTETVMVTSEAMMVETTSSQFSVDGINALPVNGRKYSSFALLKPGAVNVVTKSGETETPRLREYFPETLLWQPALETDAAGRASLRFKLADNITTWKMSLIGSTLDGQLGLAETEFRAFQPFFVEHDPPRVLTEGDEISLPVVVRNYLASAQDVRLELKPEGWFTLLGPSEKRARVAAGDSARETFDFRAAASVTDGKQRVTAYGSTDSDAIERTLSVHPDGRQLSNTTGRVFNDAATLDVNFPAATIAGTARAELRVYPNLLAHVVESVEGIIKRPYGCGEQTISSTYPSLIVLSHYKQRGVELPKAARKAGQYVNAGYERLLSYRDAGGGFTYWGRGNPNTALTAYALKFLTDARAVVSVDKDVSDDALAWLVKTQRFDGAWQADEWQGSNGQNTLRLTAYVARTLAESGVKTDDGQSNAKAGDGQSNAKAAGNSSSAKTSDNRSASGAKEKTPAVALRHALEFLRPYAEKSDDAYMLASFCIAARAAGERESAATATSRLVALEHAEGFWNESGSTPFHGWGLAGRIETTALALRALASSDAAQARPANETDSPTSKALFYLLGHKDVYGVWYSTQATVNVLDALDALTTRGGRFAATRSDAADVFVNNQHAATLQLSTDAPDAPVTLDISPFLNAAGANRVEIRRPRGSSQATAHVVSTFYVPWSDPNAPLTPNAGATTAPRLSVGFDRTEGEAARAVNCSVEVERGSYGYGMLLAEVGLPPGAEVDRASLESALQNPDARLDRYDVLPDRVVLYLQPSGKQKARLQFKFTPRYSLRALTAPSQIYDYYNPEARTVLAPTRFVIR